jgi:hypothetical protein
MLARILDLDGSIGLRRFGMPTLGVSNVGAGYRSGVLGGLLLARRSRWCGFSGLPFRIRAFAMSAMVSVTAQK